MKENIELKNQIKLYKQSSERLLKAPQTPVPFQPTDALQSTPSIFNEKP